MFSVQCLLLGLHGYLIHFAPLAFIPHCQNRSCRTPSRLLVHMGSEHFTATPYVLSAPPGLSLAVSFARRNLKSPDFTKDLQDKLRMF